MPAYTLTLTDVLKGQARNTSETDTANPPKKSCFLFLLVEVEKKRNSEIEATQTVVRCVAAAAAESQEL